MCSGCGFAGVQDEFAGDEVGAASAAETAGGRVSVSTCESVLGSEKYEAAAAIAERRGAGPLAAGDLLLRAAWCCVDEADVEGERFFRRKAASSYEGALSRYDEVSRDRRAEYTYLVGLLTALLVPILWHLFPLRWVAFVLFAVVLVPSMGWNAVFHAGATVASRTYCPGLITALALYLPLVSALGCLALREDVMSPGTLLGAVGVAGVFHAAEVGHNVYKAW